MDKERIPKYSDIEANVIWVLENMLPISFKRIKYIPMIFENCPAVCVEVDKDCLVDVDTRLVRNELRYVKTDFNTIKFYFGDRLGRQFGEIV